MTRLEVYKVLYIVLVSMLTRRGLTQDKASRKANIFAVKYVETFYQHKLKDKR